MMNCTLIALGITAAMMRSPLYIQMTIRIVLVT